MLCRYLQLIFIISLNSKLFLKCKNKLICWYRLINDNKRQKGCSTFTMSSDLCLRKNIILWLHMLEYREVLTRARSWVKPMMIRTRHFLLQVTQCDPNNFFVFQGTVLSVPSHSPISECLERELKVISCFYISLWIIPPQGKVCDMKTRICRCLKHHFTVDSGGAAILPVYAFGILMLVLCKWQNLKYIIKYKNLGT